MRSGSGAQVLFAAAACVIGATLVAAIVVLGSPGKHRKQRLDSVRVANLYTLQQLTVSFTKLHKQLPDSLETLARDPGYHLRLADPQSGASYGYERLTQDTFRLCATFDLPLDVRSDSDSEAQTWAHGVGRQCFDHRVDVAPEGSPR